jgi:hypothetical protein
MKKLLLAMAFAAAAFTAPAQAESVGSACARQGQALGYATGNRYLGYRYDRDCQVLTPLPRTTTAAPSPDLRSLEEARRRREAAVPAPTTKSAAPVSPAQTKITLPDQPTPESATVLMLALEEALYVLECLPSRHNFNQLQGRRETQEQAAAVCQREWLAMPEEKRNQHLPADGEPRLSRSSLDWFYQKLMFQCLMRSIGAQDFVDLEIGLRAKHAGM